MQLAAKPFTSNDLRIKPSRQSNRRAGVITPIRANLLDKLLNPTKEEEKPLFFKYDPSMQRWVRSKSKAPSAAETTMQPMSGPSYTVWPVCWAYLVSKKLKSIDEEEALKLMKKGAVLIDVRLAKAYTAQHAKGAISVPMYQITPGNATMDKVKRFVMASLAMDATERIVEFPQNVEKAVGSKRKKIIVMCDLGGTLDTVVKVERSGKVNENDPDRAFGRETRSLKACYELLKYGFSEKDVYHLKGGLGTWRYNGFPLEEA